MKRILLCISLLVIPKLHAMQKQMQRPKAAAAEYAGAGTGAGAGTTTAKAIPLAAGEKKVTAAAATKEKDEGSIRKDTVIAVKPIDFSQKLTELIAAHRALTPAQQAAAAPAFWPKIEVLLKQVRATHTATAATQKDEIDALTAENNQLVARVEVLQKQVESDVQKALTTLEETIKMVKEPKPAAPGDQDKTNTDNAARNNQLKGAAKATVVLGICACLRKMYNDGVFRKMKCEIL